MSETGSKANRTVVFVLLCIAVVTFPLAAQEATRDPKNFEKVKAQAETGDAVGQRELGHYYYNGVGVTKDLAEAMKWYRKAAEQNDTDGVFYLAEGYFGGKGLAQDQVEACKWFRKAAEQNHIPSQVMLALSYSEGEGVPKDRVQAYKWLTLAAAQGSAKARSLRDLLGSELTDVQKAEAEKLVREFKPKAASGVPEPSSTVAPTASPR